MKKVKGIAYWCSIHSPNTRFNEDGIWQVDVEVDSKTQKTLKKLGIKLIEKDNGVVVFRPKRNVKRSKGEGTNEAPSVFDKFGNEFNLDIGNGSQIEVAFNTFEYKRISGVGADLVAIKVIEHIPYSKDAKDVFDFEEDVTSEKENPFD